MISFYKLICIQFFYSLYTYTYIMNKMNNYQLENKSENGLFIFRRDLRIIDNNGLNLLNDH